MFGAAPTLTLSALKVASVNNARRTPLSQLTCIGFKTVAVPTVLVCTLILTSGASGSKPDHCPVMLSLGSLRLPHTRLFQTVQTCYRSICLEPWPKLKLTRSELSFASADTGGLKRCLHSLMLLGNKTNDIVVVDVYSISNRFRGVVDGSIA